MSSSRVPTGIQPRASRGAPLPLGSSPVRDGINFAVFARHATSMALVVFRPGEPQPLAELALDPHLHRTGDVWHIHVAGLPEVIDYGFRADRANGDARAAHRYATDRVLADPYARVLVRQAAENGDRPPSRWRSRIVDAAFEWGDDQPLNRPLSDTIIYEMNVRAFTMHPSSGVTAPGTFQGVIDKIPYLQELGVTAVELLPVTEFDELDVPRTDPTTGQPLRNLWGYHPLSFFACKQTYAAAPTPEGAIREFKTMVQALHRAGIEVILDMVFNHTGESAEEPISFRGLDNATYYLMDRDTGADLNYSGCGNTVNCNHPVVRNLILDSLHYWVTEMHVDGFRFDLASILGRGRDGEVMAHPPLLERIAEDPVLAGTKLLAEAWDAAGLYQVGSFPAWSRWAEWNGTFRDAVRRFVKGDAGQVETLAARLLGSPDLYDDDGRSPFHSINFVTSHDGFTLRDLVSYDAKHNEANGEDNRDGADQNDSWNCGHEGPTDDPAIAALRMRQSKNLVTLLMLSHGVPMVLAGDERCRTQHGNNNAYCQDGPMGWIDWQRDAAGADLERFFKLIIRFRRAHRILRVRDFASDNGDARVRVTWHGVEAGEPDWSFDSRTLAMQLEDRYTGDQVYLATSAYWEDLEFGLPELPSARRWYRVIDTFEPGPLDIVPLGSEVRIDRKRVPVRARSTVVLVAKR